MSFAVMSLVMEKAFVSIETSQPLLVLRTELQKCVTCLNCLLLRTLPKKTRIKNTCSLCHKELGSARREVSHPVSLHKCIMVCF